MQAITSTNGVPAVSPFVPRPAPTIDRICTIAQAVWDSLAGVSYAFSHVQTWQERHKLHPIKFDHAYCARARPGMDRIATCRSLRTFHTGPLLMLTAQEGDLQEVIALNAGIDDFMQKPIRPHVLKARIQALLRRHTPAPSVLELPGLRIERDSRSVLLDAQPVDLTDSEFELLWTLASHAGEVVPRDMLFQRLRSREYDGLDRSVDMRISKLRKKLASCTDRELIRTLRQLGYVFIAG